MHDRLQFDSALRSDAVEELSPPHRFHEPRRSVTCAAVTLRTRSTHDRWSRRRQSRLTNAAAHVFARVAVTGRCSMSPTLRQLDRNQVERARSVTTVWGDGAHRQTRTWGPERTAKTMRRTRFSELPNGRTTSNAGLRRDQQRGIVEQVRNLRGNHGPDSLCQHR